MQGDFFSYCPFKIFFILIFKCVWVFCLQVSMNFVSFLTTKRVLDPLNLEILMAVNHQVGAGNQTPVSRKSSQCP